MTRAVTKRIFVLMRAICLAVACVVLLGGCDLLWEMVLILLDPCDSVLVDTWNVSSDYSDAAAISWCRGLCSFLGYSYDRVERTRYVLGDLLACYGCK